jgi:hypothetical protein
MNAALWPDMTDKEPSVVACPECLRLTHYALNTNRYVCPIHGPVVDDEFLPRLESTS